MHGSAILASTDRAGLSRGSKEVFLMSIHTQTNGQSCLSPEKRPPKASGFLEKPIQWRRVVTAITRMHRLLWLESCFPCFVCHRSESCVKAPDPFRPVFLFFCSFINCFNWIHCKTTSCSKWFEFFVIKHARNDNKLTPFYQSYVRIAAMTLPPPAWHWTLPKCLWGDANSPGEGTPAFSQSIRLTAKSNSGNIVGKISREEV